MALLAERARSASATLAKVEGGDKSVTIGTYASLLVSLGLVEGLGTLSDPEKDVLGQKVRDDNLQQCVRLHRDPLAINQGRTIPKRDEF